MLRKDLIPFLVDRPRSVSQLSRETGRRLADLLDDLRHLQRTLARSEWVWEFRPARCRKCGFTFASDRLTKPSRCPECHATWITEPTIALRRVLVAGTSGIPAPPDPAQWLEFLDHTADTGIVVTARTLAQLFERTAWGMFSLLTDLDRVEPTSASKLTVEADDRESLLVRWLSELNFRHLTRRELYGQFDVTSVGDTQVQARIRGQPIDPARHVIHTEIKAVTFHGLDLRQVGDGWRAQVIFDL